MIISQLIGLPLYIRERFSLHHESDAASAYLAYGIGPEVLAVTVRELNARNDEDALKEATPLFREELERIEVWCGSRKVGTIPPRSNEVSDGEPVRDSA
jgi:hypothetical protein